jgi:hypothetical protein
MFSKFKKIAVFAGMILGTNTIIQAQCDCPGNVPPPMIVVSGNVNNGKLMPYEGDAFASVFYSYSQGDKVASADIIRDNRFKREYRFNYVGFFASYGLSPRMAIEVESGYFDSFIKDYYGEYKNSKFSHILAGIKYNLLSSKYTDELIANFGLRAPLNSQDIDTAGYVKPANSSFGARAALLYNYVLSSKSNLIFNVKYDVNINDKKRSRVGDGFLTQLIYRYDWLESVKPAISLEYEKREKDVYNNKSVTNSGADIVSIRSSITLIPFDYPVSINVNTSVPVYYYYKGLQSTQNFSLAASIGISF